MIGGEAFEHTAVGERKQNREHSLRNRSVVGGMSGNVFFWAIVCTANMTPEPKTMRSPVSVPPPCRKGSASSTATPHAAAPMPAHPRQPSRSPSQIQAKGATRSGCTLMNTAAPRQALVRAHVEGADLRGGQKPMHARAAT